LTRKTLIFSEGTVRGDRSNDPTSGVLVFDCRDWKPLGKNYSLTAESVFGNFVLVYHPIILTFAFTRKGKIF
jgi:hypothetical protein